MQPSKKMTDKRKRLYVKNKEEQDFLIKARTEFRGLVKAAKASNIDVEDVKHAWLKNGNSSLFVTNPLHKDKKQTYTAALAFYPYQTNRSMPVSHNRTRKS